LKGHNGWVNEVAFSPDEKQIATVAKDGTTRVWDATTGENLLTIPVDSEGVGGVAFSPDRKRLAAIHAFTFLRRQSTMLLHWQNHV